MAIQHNSDFLFIYEAIQCNPNGDPDQENKPRMDYDTDTNLVTDVRVKRYIRDFLKQEGKEIFVDLESEAKVTMEQKFQAVLNRIWDKDDEMSLLIEDDDLNNIYQKEYKKDSFEETIKNLQGKTKNLAINPRLNKALLNGLVKNRFLDVRMFGSAFALEGFNKAMTGPIQMNWGYSLNKVYLLDSDTISSIMNEDNSTFGKDYRVKYSLIAFHGSINKAASKTTGLTDDDIKLFRDAIWKSLSANPTRSKLNQYPKLYVEIVYNEGFFNGHFGDLRNLVKVNPKEQGKDREVRGLQDLHIDASALLAILKDQKGNEKPIKEVIIHASPDMESHANYGSN